MAERYRKKLIEVALPLEAINVASAREKSIRHGHPSTLHLWWARRPLAAARAVIFAQMVDDPSAWPERFPTDEEQDAERQRLFRIIEDLVKWENTTNEEILEQARAEIRRSWRDTCEDNKGHPRAAERFDPEKIPGFHDPFCGGGALPLEAQRLGLEAWASDLNPVAVLINKAMIEVPPKFVDRTPVGPLPPGEREQFPVGGWTGATGLAEDVRRYGSWMRSQARERIGHTYPNATLPDGTTAAVFGWIWCRTLTCPNPACGAEMPLVRSFELVRKAGRRVVIEPRASLALDRVEFTVKEGQTRAREATVGRAGAMCLVCGTPVTLQHVRAEGQEGRIGAQLMAMVADTAPRRSYLDPDPEHEKIAVAVDVTDAPDTALPQGGLGFRVQNYGLTRHRDLFTSRQLLCLGTLSDLVGEARDLVVRDTQDSGYADAVAIYLGLAVGRVADLSSALVGWLPSLEAIGHTFPRGAVPMTWDFVESNPLHDKWDGALKWIVNALVRLPTLPPGHVVQRDARAAGGGPYVVSTDPPYYDNIGYADLSDFFYVWLRRALGRMLPDLFSTLLTPKDAELVADPSRAGDRKRADEHFERGLRQVFEALTQVQHESYPLTVYYAFKQAESDDGIGTASVASTGWETMLEGLIGSGFSIDGTWPIRTERGVRVRGLGSNALASSVVLVCRPRSSDAPIATRREFLGALKADLPRALRQLQHGNIAPVDLAQSAIGPGMAIYTRYAKVLDADGSPLSVRDALALINQILDEVLAEQEGEFDVDTRWAVAWFDQCGFAEGGFGMAETLSKAKNTSVGGMVEAGIVEAGRGKVRLLRPDELPADWDPVRDSRLTVWEATHQLVRVLNDGEQAAAELVRRLGGVADSARDLAYRLYVSCERKKRAQEALAYNGLVQSWPEIRRIAAEAPGGPAQQTLEI